MKKIIIAILALAFLIPSAIAQNITINWTDPNTGFPYEIPVKGPSL
jgi:hypothetical protein